MDSSIFLCKAPARYNRHDARCGKVIPSNRVAAAHNAKKDPLYCSLRCAQRARERRRLAARKVVKNLT